MKVKVKLYDSEELLAEYEDVDETIFERGQTLKVANRFYVIAMDPFIFRRGDDNTLMVFVDEDKFTSYEGNVMIFRYVEI